jgi:hypothetical protein
MKQILFALLLFAPIFAVADHGAELRCRATADRGGFLTDEAIFLCAGAQNEGPALCGVKAWQNGFSKEQSIELCHDTGSIEIANCAINAYEAFLYSRAEAVQLCKASSN